MNKRALINLENPLLNYVGTISYGLYIYHLIAVIVTPKLAVSWFGFTNLSSATSYPFVILLVLFFTVFSSNISYTFFEKPRLDKKSKFSSILSGDQVKIKNG